MKFSAVFVLHSASDVPAASLPISWSAVQQLYAFGQIASAKSFAVLSIAMPSTPPQPSNAADKRPTETTEREVFVRMPPPCCKSHPSARIRSNPAGFAVAARQAFGTVFSL